MLYSILNSYNLYLKNNNKGKGANKAIACSRLGSKCSVIAKVIHRLNYEDNNLFNNINPNKNILLAWK